MAGGVLDGLDTMKDDLASFYKDLHAHPETAFDEHRTAGKVADRLRKAELEVTTEVGRTGVVGMLRNGDGPTVLLRADMDALPVTEQTGLPYASTVEGKMHACGHDVHVTCLLGALELLAGARQGWSGTVMAVFQPAEEAGGGAQAMVDDGLYDRFGKPDVVLGQHVAPFPAGKVACHTGPAFAAQDMLKVTLHGRGGHGSMPATTIDPVVMAAATVMRLQTVVSRELGGDEKAVVTVGSLRAGTEANVIPDNAELLLSIRTFTEPVRDKVLAAIDRIVKGEAVTAGADRTPDVAELDRFPLLVNDADATARTAAAFRSRFGDGDVIDAGQMTGSEDVGVFATAADVPICYWLLGGVDPETFAAAAKAGTVERDIPSNHSPKFAPVVEPTLSMGVTALVTAATTWLGGAG
ncbi:amidohydrolase [Actinomadura hibisca]|uniref:amidohydrolase n=1 Tax=Actinomadura hibisca TaxID=68565 RepID=UPI000ADA8F08|nr:amidohydrolase [Actinomadura hibisca]